MYREGDNGFFYCGPDFLRDRRFSVTVGFGRIENPPEGGWRFRHMWRWSPRWPITVRKFGNVLRVEYGFGYRRRVRLIELTT